MKNNFAHVNFFSKLIVSMYKNCLLKILQFSLKRILSQFANFNSVKIVIILGMHNRNRGYSDDADAVDKQVSWLVRLRFLPPGRWEKRVE